MLLSPRPQLRKVVDIHLRFSLNYKGIPYKTIWLEYLEIEGEYKKAGIEPSGKRGGKDLYTCPGLVDPNTGAALADSQRSSRPKPTPQQLLLPKSKRER